MEFIMKHTYYVNNLIVNKTIEVRLEELWRIVHSVYCRLLLPGGPAPGRTAVCDCDMPCPCLF